MAGGLTIIEKLEQMIGKNAASSFGIVLLTPDDIGFSKARRRTGETKSAPECDFRDGYALGLLDEGESSHPAKGFYGTPQRCSWHHIYWLQRPRKRNYSKARRSPSGCWHNFKPRKNRGSIGLIMTDKKPKRPRDVSQLAKMMVDIATGEKSEAISPVNEIARRAGGKGGNERAASLAEKRRSEIATLAAKARWKSKN